MDSDRLVLKVTGCSSPEMLVDIAGAYLVDIACVIETREGDLYMAPDDAIAFDDSDAVEWFEGVVLDVLRRCGEDCEVVRSRQPSD